MSIINKSIGHGSKNKQQICVQNDSTNSNCISTIYSPKLLEANEKYHIPSSNTASSPNSSYIIFKKYLSPKSGQHSKSTSQHQSLNQSSIDQKKHIESVTNIHQHNDSLGKNNKGNSYPQNEQQFLRKISQTSTISPQKEVAQESVDQSHLFQNFISQQPFIQASNGSRHESNKSLQIPSKLYIQMYEQMKQSKTLLHQKSNTNNNSCQNLTKIIPNSAVTNAHLSKIAQIANQPHNFNSNNSKDSLLKNDNNKSLSPISKKAKKAEQNQPLSKYQTLLVAYSNANKKEYFQPDLSPPHTSQANQVKPPNYQLTPNTINQAILLPKTSKSFFQPENREIDSTKESKKNINKRHSLQENKIHQSRSFLNSGEKQQREKSLINHTNNKDRSHSQQQCQNSNCYSSSPSSQIRQLPISYCSNPQTSGKIVKSSSQKQSPDVINQRGQEYPFVPLSSLANIKKQEIPNDKKKKVVQKQMNNKRDQTKIKDILNSTLNSLKLQQNNLHSNGGVDQYYQQDFTKFSYLQQPLSQVSKTNEYLTNSNSRSNSNIKQNSSIFLSQQQQQQKDSQQELKQSEKQNKSYVALQSILGKQINVSQKPLNNKSKNSKQIELKELLIAFESLNKEINQKINTSSRACLKDKGFLQQFEKGVNLIKDYDPHLAPVSEIIIKFVRETTPAATTNQISKSNQNLVRNQQVDSKDKYDLQRKQSSNEKHSKDRIDLSEKKRDGISSSQSKKELVNSQNLSEVHNLQKLVCSQQSEIEQMKDGQLKIQKLISSLKYHGIIKVDQNGENHINLPNNVNNKISKSKQDLPFSSQRSNEEHKTCCQNIQIQGNPSIHDSKAADDSCKFIITSSLQMIFFFLEIFINMNQIQKEGSSPSIEKKDINEQKQFNQSSHTFAKERDKLILVTNEKEQNYLIDNRSGKQQLPHFQNQSYPVLNSREQPIVPLNNYMNSFNNISNQDISHNSNAPFIKSDKVFIKKLELSNLHTGNSHRTTFIEQISPNADGKPVMSKIEIEDISGYGYHDEFMSRINEFSLSWREAGKLEQRKS